MFNHKHYVPILKWKMGEYQALSRLTAHVKDRITPLIEIPPIGYDFENETASKTIEQHLGMFGVRLRDKWQSRRCFVDLNLLGCDTTMTNGQHCVGFLLGRARQSQCSVVPVVRLGSSASFISAVAAAITLDGRGICLRLIASDFDRPNLQASIDNLLSTLHVSWSDSDLVVDLDSFGYPSNSVFVSTAAAILNFLPYLNQWRTLTLAGTSFPQVINSINGAVQIIPRREWVTYRALVSHLGLTARIPTFGDYGAVHPETVELDMRVIKPLAKLKYTTDDAWHLSLGSNVRTFGFGQYQQLCSNLVALPYFNGHGFSSGDDYIEDCAAGIESTGNLSTWVWVSTNRHLTKVVADLAILFGP